MERRLTIGVIIDSVHEAYQSSIWRGICAAAEEHQVNLVTFVGTSQDGVDFFDTHYDVTLECAVHAGLSGVIVFSGAIVEHHGVAFATELCSRFQGIPLVCLSESLPGYPCIGVDNRVGMEAMIDHFVQVHNLTRIAFVCGPEGHDEAEARLDAYRQGLERNDRDFCPELVCPGGFLARDGVAAVQSLLHQNVSFDAVICASDGPAFGVLEALEQSDKHVPGDVAVAGFDDVAAAADVHPTLTTVRQPLFRMGQESVRGIIDRIQGRPVADRILLSTEPVFRRSCGCFPDHVLRARSVLVRTGDMSEIDIPTVVANHVQEVAGVNPEAVTGERTFCRMVSDLINALVIDVKKPAIRNIFLTEVDILLFAVARFANAALVMQVLLRDISTYVATLLDSPEEIAEAGNLLRQAETLVSDYSTIAERKRLQADQRFDHRVNVACGRIISTFEQRQLIDDLTEHLRSLEIPSFSVALFSDNGVERTRWKYSDEKTLFVACGGHGQEMLFPRNRPQISGGSLLPDGLYDPSCCRQYLFLPLFFQTRYLGYTLLEKSPAAPLFMYEELRLHISSAVQSSLLLQQFRRQSHTDELTGLLNRRGFLESVSDIVKTVEDRNTDLLFFFGDIDGLKTINDTFGHEEGDAVISAAAAVLRETFRDQDILARIGGDEFVIALQVKYLPGLEDRITRRFLGHVAAFNEEWNQPFRLSMSLGNARMDVAARETIEQLMKRADDEMMAVKQARGVNRMGHVIPATGVGRRGRDS